MYFEQLKNNRIPFITSLIIPILRDSMFIYSGTFPIFIDYKLNRRLPQNGRNRNKMDGRWNVKRTKIFPFFICKIPVRKIIKQHIVKMSENRTIIPFHYEKNISIANTQIGYFSKSDRKTASIGESFPVMYSTFSLRWGVFLENNLLKNIFFPPIFYSRMNPTLHISFFKML